MSGRHLTDAETIEVAELLCLASEMCRTADSFVAAALARFAGVGSDDAELFADAVRLASMLSGMTCRSAPVPGVR